MSECRGICAARCSAEMNVTFDRGENRSFDKHDSSVSGTQTQLLTFDREPLHTDYLMHLTTCSGTSMVGVLALFQRLGHIHDSVKGILSG